MDAVLENEYTLLTKDLLKRTEYIKESIASSMVVGDTSIIRGVVIFEDIVKGFNFDEIDNNTIEWLNNYIINMLNNKKGNFKNVNNYVYFGIERCFMMLYSYYKTNILNKKKEKYYKHM